MNKANTEKGRIPGMYFYARTRHLLLTCSFNPRCVCGQALHTHWLLQIKQLVHFVVIPEISVRILCEGSSELFGHCLCVQ